jgi:hypothetical protein
MTVEEAKGVCKDRSKWKEVISAYPKGKRAWCYVCNEIKVTEMFLAPVFIPRLTRAIVYM